MSTRPEPEEEGAVGITIQRRPRLRVALDLRFERDVCFHGRKPGALRLAEQTQKYPLNTTITRD